MSRLRVLLLSHTYFPSVYRGKLRRLAAMPGIELTLAAIPRIGTTSGQLSYEVDAADTYRQIMLPSLFTSHNVLRTYSPIGLFNLIRTNRPDIVHVEAEPYAIVLLQMALLKSIAKFKLIFFTWENIYRSISLPVRLLMQHNFHRADAAIAGNRGAVDVLRRRGFRRMVEVIPQVGVNPTSLGRLEPRQAFDFRSAGFVVGFVGRLVAEKGVRDLVEAFAHLREPAHLLLVGGGALKEELAQRCLTLGFQSRVHFAGNVPFAEVTEYLKCMDVLVLPSRTTLNWKEQFGHVIVEAMACGVPVVGSDSGAIPEVIGDAGLVFPEGDVPALAERLRQLEGSYSQRDDVGTRGLLRAGMLFSDEAIARATYRFYENL